MFSEAGYCLSREKFMKMGTQIIEVKIKGYVASSDIYDNVMSHCTIALWANFKIKANKNTLDAPLLIMLLSNRFTTTIKGDYNMIFWTPVSE